MRKFIIVGTQRTGSSTIAETIGLHPRFVVGWEWVLQVPLHRKVKVANSALNGEYRDLLKADRVHMESMSSNCDQWHGFRWLFRSSDKWLLHPSLSPAIWLDGLVQAKRWLSKQPDIRVLHIVRRDNLAWIRSKYAARKTGAFVSSEYPSDLKIRVNLSEVKRRILAKHWLDRELSMLSHTNPYHCVHYEDYIQNQEAQLSRIWDFFGEERVSIDSRKKLLKRQSSSSPAEQLANAAELISELNRLSLSEYQD